METHQMNNYFEVERADSIYWEIFDRQSVEKEKFMNLSMKSGPITQLMMIIFGMKMSTKI